jgi:hypothetical protein
VFEAGRVFVGDVEVSVVVREREPAHEGRHG